MADTPVNQDVEELYLARDSLSQDCAVECHMQDKSVIWRRVCIGIRPAPPLQIHPPHWSIAKGSPPDELDRTSSESYAM